MTPSSAFSAVTGGPRLIQSRPLFDRARAWLTAKAPAPAGEPLSVVTETEALRASADAGSLEPPPAPGVIEVAYPATVVPEAELPNLFNDAAGPALPDWARSSGGGLRFQVDLARVRDVFHAPGFGAVLDRQGRVYKASVAEARFVSPDLVALPGVRLQDGEPRFAPAGSEPRLASASVFMPWGARFNYGHFLLDALPALALFADRGLLSRFPPVSPSLEAWQRELLELMLPGQPVIETEAPLLRVDDLLFTSCMDHFLHAPNLPLDRVRARILATLPRPDATPKRVYVTRRSQGKRRLVNELELEAALATRGFSAVEPETLSAAEQVAMFSQAEVVVGPTGAALAGVLFMKPAAKIFELQPENYQGIWVRSVAHFVGVHWHGYFCRSPLPGGEATPVPGSPTESTFSWAAPPDEVLAYVDSRL